MTCQTLSALVRGFILLSSFLNTVFENCPKSRIQHCERSELRLHYEWTKVDENAKNGQYWRVCDQKVLPDRSI